MIKSVKGTATRQFLEKGKSSFPGMDPEIARLRLAQLDAATSLDSFGRLASVGLHKLKGPLKAYWSIDINRRWRLLFKFRDGDAYEVHFFDPHQG
jgi:proteic killer suppression protein